MSSSGEALFERPPLSERNRALEVLRDETIGGLLLLGAAIVAMAWANSPWASSYASLTQVELGVGHLRLTVSQWAADGLLAVFFFVAGLELKHEFVVGSLSRLSRAVVPVAAALGGMVVPALIFAAINAASSEGQPAGWAIPVATDIAFALAVLAVVGRRLPVALRAFLLTLAVVDDLGAIVIIALFYSSGFAPLWLVAAVALLALYAVLQRRRVRSPLLYVPIAFATWYCVHESGVHATIAGVALGLLTRVKPDPGEADAPAERMQHLVQPLSAALCVPLFALFSAGVDLRSVNVAESLTSPLSLGVIVGLVVGKPIGVTLGAWATARFTRAKLSSTIRWADVATIGLLAGIGFTVSLLISELAYPSPSSLVASAKLAVLTASVASALVAGVAILARNRHYAQIDEIEESDSDHDGVPDVYSAPDSPGASDSTGDNG